MSNDNGDDTDNDATDDRPDHSQGYDLDGSGSGGYWEAFDPGIFRIFSSRVYEGMLEKEPELHPETGELVIDPDTGKPVVDLATLDREVRRYQYILDMATHVLQEANRRGMAVAWQPVKEDGKDLFGTHDNPGSREDAAKGDKPPEGMVAFMQWWRNAQNTGVWDEVFALAAVNFAEQIDPVTGKPSTVDYIETGTPGNRGHRIFERNSTLVAADKYGIGFTDLMGSSGLRLLQQAANWGLELEPLLDIARSAHQRALTSGQVGQTEEQDAVSGAIRRYALAVNNNGLTHVQAKIRTFGGHDLLQRVMGVDGTDVDSDLTLDEVNQLYEILGTDFIADLSGMPSFDGQDLVGSLRFSSYLDDLATRTDTVNVQGDAMREAARTLAQGWRLRPMSDKELDEMVTAFGMDLRNAESRPPVWGGGIAPVTEVPDMQSSVLSAVRGSSEYERLYGDKPVDMSEEEWINRFAGAGQTLLGSESRAGTRAGMESGSLTQARQVAMTDKSARGGTWHRRMAAFRKAFE